MRVRKLPWAEEYLPKQAALVVNCQDYKGKWKELLGRDQIHLEIGSGKGDYWKGMSEKYPEYGWIGVERNTSVAALALKKVEGNDLPSRRFICSDAKYLDEWFEEKELSVIHLNFSDPWPKKRNMKRRLSHHQFLEVYRKLLDDDGKIIMKTDNTQLFEFSLIEFQNSGFHLDEVYLDFRKEEHDEDVITEYEAKFIKKGQPIYRGVFSK